MNRTFKKMIKKLNKDIKKIEKREKKRKKYLQKLEKFDYLKDRYGFPLEKIEFNVGGVKRLKLWGYAKEK